MDSPAMLDRMTYDLVLPPGWVRIPADERAEPTARAIIQSIVKDLPPHQATKARTFMRQQMTSAIAYARQSNGLDLFLPVAPVAGAPVPASIVVSRLRPTDDARSPQEVLLAFAARGGAAATQLDGVLAVRRVVELPASTGGADRPEGPASRQVTYLAHASWLDQWVSITASIVRLPMPDADEMVDAVQILVDAIVDTFRFETRGRAASTSIDSAGTPAAPGGRS